MVGGEWVGGEWVMIMGDAVVVLVVVPQSTPVHTSVHYDNHLRLNKREEWMVEQWAMIIACKEAGHLGRRDNGYMLTALIAGGRTVGEHVSRVRFTFAWLLRGPRSTILIGVHTSYNSHRRSASERGAMNTSSKGD